MHQFDSTVCGPERRRLQRHSFGIVFSRWNNRWRGCFKSCGVRRTGRFRPAEVLKGTDDKPLLIPLGTDKDAWIDVICTRPMAVDWDGDGKLDLITGNFTGTFYLFKGEGKGRFQPKGELITSENGPLKIDGNHSDPFVVDWDHDGDLDLLSGSSEGGRRSGRRTSPAQASRRS